MRIARYVLNDQPPSYGIVEGRPSPALQDGPFYQEIQPVGTQSHALEDVRLLAPVIRARRLWRWSRNYADHAAEMGNEVPTSPMLFFKPNTSVVGSGDPVTLPSWTKEVSYEAELAVVIGRICKRMFRLRRYPR